MIDTILLNGLWQGLPIVAVAAAISALLPRKHAATRYAVWFTALLALALVPVVSVVHLGRPIAPLPPSIVHTAAATSIVETQAANAGGLWLALFWLTGVAFCCARLSISHVRIARIVRRAVPAPELGSDVMTSGDVGVPIAARIASPVILIPRSLASTLDRGDLESIVQHERAHIRRFDLAGNLIQRFVEALLFLNPWAYVIGRQLVKEREFACDDWAANVTGEPDRLAACLGRLAESAHRSRVPLFTPSAIGSKPMIVGRIARLLDGKAAAVKTNYFVVLSAVLALGALAIALQTSNGLASVGNAVAANNPPASKCYADVKPLEAAMPNIPKADYQPKLSANALVTVASNGRPTDAKIVKSSGNAAVDRATTEAAMASTYSPKMVDCKATTGQYLFQVDTGP
ncbi:MAG TPA: TonB family protein [Candidatus Tumulicola sp.]|nr:TonB family protein [Candidatus Tumulicola sp.]